MTRPDRITAIPLDRFITTSALTDTLMLLPLWSVQDRIGADWIELAAAGLAVGLAAAFLFVPRRYAIVLPLVVLTLWLAAIRPIWFGKHGFERASVGALFQGIREADRDWIDRTVGSDADVAALWSRATPEMAGYFQEELNENARNGVINRIDNVRLVQGDLSESWREGATEYATVAMRYTSVDYTTQRATGQVVEGDKQPFERTELWTFMRSQGGDWLLSAIQEA